MSQVNYFALQPDDESFFLALLARGDTVVAPGRFFVTSEPLPIERFGSDFPIELTVIHQALASTYPTQQVADGPYAGQYHFPSYHSATIEWSRSHLSGGALVSGRIFAKVGWLGSPEHNRIFRSWYGSIERWLKHHTKRVDSTWWIAPAAEEWSRGGGLLAFGPGNSLRTSLAGAGAT